MRKKQWWIVSCAAVIVLVTALFLIIHHPAGRIPRPDVSRINVDDVHIVRFDQMLYAANDTNYRRVLKDLETEYPDIFYSYTHNFWSFYPSDTTQPFDVYDSVYTTAVSNPWMRNLYDSVQLMYPNMNDVEKQLKKAFRYYKYYFPDSIIPQLYTYIGPFVYWTIIDSSTLGIELDMFMGHHFGLYGHFEANMPRYISIRCDKPFIAVNVMRSLMDGAIPGKGADASLLDEILRQGKLMYYLDLVLPDVPDSVKMGYTSAQITWCEGNAAEIWKFFVGEEDLLFTTKSNYMRKYLDESPTSSGMPDEAPGRVAVWMGWQIIRDYMQKNPGISIQALFANLDAIGILKDADYRPKDRK